MGARFRILGRTGLLIGTQVDDGWGQPKLRGLLAALLLNPGRPVKLDTLVEWIWPEDKKPQQQATTLYTYANRVRGELDRMDQPPRLIAPGGGTYQIEIDRSDVDYYTFRDQVEQAQQHSREGDHATARDLLGTAVEMWTDRALADLEGERADRWRAWAEENLLIPAHSSLVRELLALCEFAEALRRLDELAVEHHENLTVMKLRMEALFGLHRNRDATTYFLNRRKRFMDEGDHAEADELTRWHDQLLAGQIGTANAAAIGQSQMHTPSPPQYLPRDIPDFVGREDPLQRLDEIMRPRAGTASTSIAVLDGPPGVGKSTLAVRWAHRTATWFPDGQLYLNLNGFADTPRVEPAAAIERLLEQLDFPRGRTTTNEARSAKLRSLLAGRKVLVVLDDASGTEHVRPLIEALPCAVLITSRQRLTGLIRQGAGILPVEPLNYPESRGLLVRRLGTERAHAEPAALSELTTMCGGITLELLLVAEHVGCRPRVRLAEFVEELREGHALLDLGDNEDNPGGSARATFSMSYQALDPDQQRLFRLLGIHPGPDISMDATAALMGMDRAWVKRRLDALVDAHLLPHPEERRYRMHDLLRRFAAAVAAQDEYRDERLAAEARILSYYHYGAHNADTKLYPHRVGLPTLPMAADITPPQFHDDRSALKWLEWERENINAAIRLAHSRQLNKYVTIMSSSAGETYQRMGYFEDVMFTLNIAVQLAKDNGDVLDHAYSLQNMGFTLLNLRDLSSAESCLRQAEILFRSIGFEPGIGAATLNLARISVARGDYSTGIRGYHAALAILRATDAPEAQWLVVTAQHRAATAYRLVRDMDAAIVASTEAAQLARSIGDDRGLAFSLAEMAEIYFASHDLTAARGYCTKSMALLREYHEAELAGSVPYLLGRIHRATGALDRAEQAFRAATGGYREARDPLGEANAYDQLGSVLRAQGQREPAAGAWSKAVALLEEMDIYDERVNEIRIKLAELSTLPDDPPTESTDPPDRPI